MAKPSPLTRLNLPAKVGVGVLLLGITLVVYVVVFYNDLQTSISQAKAQETQLHADLATAKSAEAAYNKDLAELRDREQRQREMRKILPESTEYPAFLSAVQSVANVAGVSLHAWNPQSEVPEQFYARVPMKLELVGRFHQIAKFFYGVGQLDRIINMENIAMTDPKEQGDEIRLKVSVLATAFHANVGAEADGARSKTPRKKR